MTGAVDLPLPGDWPRARLLRLALAGQAVLSAVAVRWLWLPAGPFGALAHYATGAGLLLAVLLAGTAFARCLRQASSLPRSFLLGGGALLALAATAIPPFLSNDLFDYLARGRVTLLGYDTYLLAPARLQGDPRIDGFLQHARWTGWPMPYPPLSAILQQLVARIDAPWLAAYAWKLLMAACFVAAGPVLAAAARVGHGERGARRALVLWLWNPALLLELCGSGHNDATVALALAVAVLAIARDQFAPAAIWFGASLLLKQGHVPLLPLLLALAFWRGRLAAFLAGGAAAAGIGVLLAFVWMSAPGALDALFDHTDTQCNSLHWLLDRVVPGSGAVLAFAGLLPFGLLLALGCHRARSAPAFAHHAALAVVVFQLLVMRAFEAWYPIWWLCLFPLATASVFQRVVELFGWLLPLSYLGRTVSQAFGSAHQLDTLLFAGLWPALLVLLEWRALLGLQATAVPDAGRESA